MKQHLANAHFTVQQGFFTVDGENKSGYESNEGVEGLKLPLILCSSSISV